MDREQQVGWARRYLVRACQTVAGVEDRQNRQGVFNGAWGTLTGDNGKTNPGGTKLSWDNLPYRILAASPHLQGISGHEEILDKLLESMPLLEALEIIERELG